MPRAPWNERKAVSISVIPFLSLSKEAMSPPQDVTSKAPFRPILTTITLLPPLPPAYLGRPQSEGGTRLPQRLVQPWCQTEALQPASCAVGNSCSGTGPGTEFNFNGHWPSHLKAETRVGPVVEAGHGQVNAAKNREKWTLDYCTQTHWAPTGCQALCWALWILQSGCKPRHWSQMDLNLNTG